MIVIDLIYNLALLVALSIVSGFIGQRWKQGWCGALLQGGVFGSVAVIGMLRPLVLAPGLIFDGRSVMISLCGLFFGPVAVAVAGGMAMVVRIFQGGIGAPMGVLVILSSACLGWIFHVRWRAQRPDLFTRQLLGFGFLVHLVMVLLIFTLPGTMVAITMKRIGPPVILLYPLATVLVGKILSDHLSKDRFLEGLRESEEKYRELVENANSIILRWDRNGRVLFLNEYGQNFFGYSQEEIIGKSVIGTIVPETEKEGRDLVKLMDDIFADPVTYQANVNENVRKNGSRAWIAWTNRPIYDGNGEVCGMFSVGSDITARKQAEEDKRRLEEQLQRAEKMEALGSLAGGVAHDLNNVLGVVVGYAELLLGELEASSPLRRSIENIMGGGQKAAAIVQDLLTLARRGVPGRTVLNLNKVIAANLNAPEFENLFSSHPAVRIRTDLVPDLLNIAGSVVHLGKTLYNLVSNAVEAMPEGGRLTIKTANQYLDKPIQGYDEIREGDYAVLSVSDTGEGIDAADLKRIFEPFYTKKVMGRSGTGLGLAVVWGTVKDHKGYINVQSEAGQGSTFTLYFPVTREELSAEAVSISISEYMGKGESILIVDDVEAQRNLAATMLRKLNYKVENVSSGEAALAYLETHQVDLVVLDMIMDPGMDGLDTYRGIVQIRPKQKAVIVSGFSESERVSAAQALGAGPYVRKPYVLEKLGMAVRKELERDA